MLKTVSLATIVQNEHQGRTFNESSQLPSHVYRRTKQYWLQHREDKVALQVYLDKLNEQPHDVITTVDDPEFDAKIQAAISQKMLEGK